MNQQAIELLEKARYEVDPKTHIHCQRDINACAYINQALTLLKQQPAERKFTKLWREKLDNAVSLFRMGRSPKDWFQGIVTGFREACDRLDRAASTNKDLVEVCEGLIDANEYARKVSLRDESPRGIVWGDVRSRLDARKLKAQSAISKAKKEEETK